MDLRDQLQTTLGTAYTLERELGGGRHVGMAFDQANRHDSAIAEFRRYPDTPYAFAMAPDGDDLGVVYKSIGELYEAKGNCGEAANYYTKFVDLWQHADSDLQPQVADVKQRLTHLRDTEKHP